VRLAVTTLALALITITALPTASAEPKRANSPAATASAATKVTRDAEKTLLAVTAWSSSNPALFADDTRRNQLFNVTSQTRRVIRSLAVLNDKEAVPFFSEYSSFATALSDLHKAVALKTDWGPLVEETLASATKALRAIQDSPQQKYSVGPELSRFRATQSSL